MTIYEEETLNLLREISGKLDALILQPPTLPYPPFPQPYNPHIPLTNLCPKCGISFDGAMGYVCSDPSCPYGGNVTC